MRLGSDFRVRGELHCVDAVEMLRGARERGESVAVAMVDDSFSDDERGTVFATVRSLHPEARRALLVPWGAWADQASARRIWALTLPLAGTAVAHVTVQAPGAALVRWIEEQAPGAEEPEHPAPLLKLAPPEQAASPAQVPPAEAASDCGATSPLAATALGAALLALAGRRVRDGSGRPKGVLYSLSSMGLWPLALCHQSWRNPRTAARVGMVWRAFSSPEATGRELDAETTVFGPIVVHCLDSSAEVADNMLDSPLNRIVATGQPSLGLDLVAAENSAVTHNAVMPEATRVVGLDVAVVHANHLTNRNFRDDPTGRRLPGPTLSHVLNQAVTLRPPWRLALTARCVTVQPAQPRSTQPSLLSREAEA